VSLDFILDMLSWGLLVTGGFFVFVGGVGALRMPDFYTRMHAAGITDTLGTILVLAGVIVQAGLSLAAVKLLAIGVFLLLTAPTAAYALANAARLSGLRPEDGARRPQEDN
jgi:multicomponent Na+:H+ antiporter subunit G